jgi:Dna[CI] antecedent, DciA
VRGLPEPIGEDIRRELGRFGPEGNLGEIVEAWPAAVGPAIAANAWPARVMRDGTLHVSTASSTWAFELTQLSASVLGHLRERLGPICPTGLRFSAGPLPELGGKEETSVKRTVPKPSEEQLAAAERIAQAVDDEELRRLVARAAAASLVASASRPDDRSVW